LEIQLYVGQVYITFGAEAPLDRDSGADHDDQPFHVGATNIDRNPGLAAGHADLGQARGEVVLAWPYVADVKIPGSVNLVIEHRRYHRAEVARG
jgi:hypothetical protein